MLLFYIIHASPASAHPFLSVQPGMVFYDEETEDEEEDEAEEEGQTTEAPSLPLGTQADERPESVLTDVTVDGLPETEVPDISGIL